MKRAVLFAIAFFALEGCTQSSDPGDPTLLHVDVEGDFRGDLVQVWIDQNFVAQKRATTNWTISLAWSKTLTGVPEGSHKVAVRLPELLVADSSVFLVRDTTHLMIGYDRDTRRLRFDTFFGQFPRD